jgi:hypothetical protein
MYPSGFHSVSNNIINISSSKVVTASLQDDSATPVNIPDTAKRGSYQFIVKSSENDGATAVFHVSSGYDAIDGSVSRLSSSPGINGEEINVIWPANQY